MNRVGAYGLSYGGVGFPPRFIEPELHWQHWDISFEREVRLPEPEWTPDRAVFHMRPAGAVVIDRTSSTSRILLPETPPLEALAHPLLGLTAVAAAGWDGAPNYHAGSFVHHGRAWLIAADAEAGKSSMLAWFATHGVDILADDLSVVRRGVVQAGPRCIDLRPGAAEHFGIGDDVGVIGTRRRWRVGLPPVTAEVPMGGWVRPRWADGISVGELSAEERLRTMALMRGFVRIDPDPAQALRLLALPAIDFARPRDWSRVDEAMRALLERLP